MAMHIDYGLQFREEEYAGGFDGEQTTKHRDTIYPASGPRRENPM
jgi:hypothetical protein